MKNKIKKVCIVGAGNWGRNHIKILNDMDCLYGIVEKDKLLVNDLKNKYPNVTFYNNLEQALEYGFDGFIVATPANTHYEIAKKILLSNHHVLVEKPLTTNLDDAIDLHEIAKKSNLNLMVGHVLLFHPAFIKIKKMIDSGKIGDLQYLYSNRLNLGAIRNNENVLWSLAPHDIALFQFLTDMRPKKIFSIGSDILQPKIHDTTITTIEYDNKIMGHIFVSWLHPFKEHRFVVIGSKGMIHFDDSIKGKPLLYYNKNIKWENNKPYINKGSVVNIQYENSMPLTEEIKYFISHLDGSVLEFSNSASAVEVMQVLTKASQNLCKGNIS